MTAEGRNYRLTFDGGCDRGRGFATFGWTLRVDGEHARSGHGVVRGITDSNVAELHALRIGLMVVRRERPGRLVILGDAKSVIGMVNREKISRRSPLQRPAACWPKVAEVKRAIAKMRKGGWDVVVAWLPRRHNGRADTLSRVAFQTYVYRPPPP